MGLMDPYDFIIAKVQEAGEILLRAREKGFEISTKGGNPRDLVTSADIEANDFLLAAIQKEFPTHGIHSEEGGNVAEQSGEVWMLDPLDGTSNFSRGIPHFSVCAVYNPVTKELFSFTKGGGAFLNGKPIRVSGVTELAKAQIVMSPGSRNPELWDWAAQSYRRLLGNSQKRGMYGSSALDICFVAAGRADAGIYGTLSTFDIAAALGILYEAGGVASNANGEALSYSEEPQRIYMANSPQMLEQIRTLLESK
jgi:myo-inositol-1(or 4)-monophosphatase